MQNKIIDFRSNPAGFLVPFEDGVELSSFENTEDEARRWFERNKNYFQLGLPIAVLGVGAAAHLGFIRSQTNLDVTVIDFRPQLISWARKIFQESDFNFIHVENSAEILAHPLLQDRIGYILPITFDPAAKHFESEFALASQHLLGRSDEVWKMKNLEADKVRHWREWDLAHPRKNIEQLILTEVLS